MARIVCYLIFDLSPHSFHSFGKYAEAFWENIKWKRSSELKSGSQTIYQLFYAKSKIDGWAYFSSAALWFVIVGSARDNRIEIIVNYCKIIVLMHTRNQC